MKQLIAHTALVLALALPGAMGAAPAKADTGIAGAPRLNQGKTHSKREVGASSGFGVRRDPINKLSDFHKGIDISRPAGTAVLAWSEGVVVRAGWLGDYGNTVDVLHSDGVKTRYAHLRTVHVGAGEKVRAGHVLGQVGRTGRTTGANLHFEVTVGDKLVDPRKHFPDPSQVVERKADAVGPSGRAASRQG
ncbi:MAG: M23 family metallopeptidase [Acidobacteriota bacterium]